MAIRKVLALPPRESRNKKVSLESRYGMWDFRLEDRVVMTRPKVVRDLFMLLAYFRR